MFPMDFEEFCRANGVQDSIFDILREHFTARRPASPKKRALSSCRMTFPGKPRGRDHPHA